MKIISIHQPETFPYPGYFSKMMLADEFIVLDDVQFKKNNYQNRNRIIHAGNPKWLTFPVDMSNRLESTISDTKFSYNVDWKSRNIKVLEDSYKDCPYYEYHMNTLREIINNSDDSLLQFNMSIIGYIRKCLSIDTPLIYSSELNLSSHKSDLVLDICRSREADGYLSGKGGRDYLDKNKFEESGIIVFYQDFDSAIPYNQDSIEFIPYMSTIDLLMNNSEEIAKEYIKNAFTYSL